MKEEIEGPHGCGVYGHRYYGITRKEVELMVSGSAIHYHRTNVFIDGVYEDGGIDSDNYHKCKSLIFELYKTIDFSLAKVIKEGDAIHEKVD
jgi:hypothetical protein